MKSKLLLLASLLLLNLGNARAQYWKPVNNGNLAGLEKTERMAMPSAYHLFSVDLAQLNNTLHTAPSRKAGVPSNVIVAFPGTDGKLQHFRLYEASVMSPELAAKHQDMQSYTGQGVEDPTATIRISVTSWGFHGMVLSAKGTYFIDPYTTDLKNYIVYKKSDLVEDRQFTCHVESEVETSAQRAIESEQSVLSNDSSLRTYRLAMACTIEYARYHYVRAGLTNGTEAQKKAAVLAAMVVTVTRVNSVYEKELAVTLELVPNNEDIIFITSDSFDNTNANTLITQSQTVITAAIGTANFDIGHTVSTGGGGLAGLGVICNSNNKARGITGSSAPVGDPYDIDFVAHEVGHQFGGSHTFNGISGSCQGNQEPAYAVEPGGGTTIMAYAGLCVTGDIQTNSDDYFHTVTLDQIYAVLRSTSCAVETTINNTAPDVPTVGVRSIPYGTAFILKGSEATDAEGDALTYSWEQTNANGTNVNRPTATSTNGPNFRSLPPTTERDRYFPQLSDVLAGNLTPTWEVIPSVARTLTFAYTVRDNSALGGQTSKRGTSVLVRNVGPFVVTSQAEAGITWIPGEQQTITWDVAGTTGSGVNTSQVNILLSTNSGLTFDTVLASATDNDGSETITVPNILNGNCRIKVEPVDNIYYAVNASVFAIGVSVSEECNTNANTASVTIPDNDPAFTTSTIEVTDGVDNVTSVTVNVNITHTGVGDLIVKAINPVGTEVILWQQRCTTNDDLIINFSDAGSNAICATTEFGFTYKPSTPLSAFNGQEANGTWTLAVSDNAAQNTGTLNNWSLTICGQVFTPLSATQFNLKDFALYPNPNNGSFNVQFTPQSQDATVIKVHDMRGREVFSSNYTATGMFNNSINLQNAQSGIYMVTVQNGSRKEVRKVVVN
ncbi:reprolysin-like metallopeptidase [Flavobacterium sp. Sd200]|uniref:T9SS type A sorting domain-containing protein n=1 Tax=Flavobacterium sp. Sd200 TaxID=2692211 RepID=UPI00136C5017|nr:zinc-dependent metalloprotease family protein [Flavobacterium sp. Sd200]